MAKHFVCIAVLSAVMALSCQDRQDTPQQAASGSETTTETAATPLEGTLWRFLEVEGRPVVQYELEETPRIRFVADDHALTAWLSCNLFHGAYESDGQSLHLSPVPTTWQDCVESHEQEEALRRALQSVTRYRIDGDQLILYADDRPVATLASMDAE